MPERSADIKTIYEPLRIVVGNGKAHPHSS